MPLATIPAMRYPLIAAACAALMLAGCATSRTIIGQDGRPLHKISCDGSALSIDACYEKAGEICGSAGYSVINVGGSSRPYFYAAPGAFYSGADVFRSVMVRCNGD